MESSEDLELESSKDLEYVDAKLEKIQERFGSINKYMQTIMKKMEKLNDSLKKITTDDSNSNSGRGRKAVIQNDRFYASKSPDPIMIAKSDPNLSPDVNLDPYPKMNPKSDSDLNQKLGTNFESGIAMVAEAIEGEDYDENDDGKELQIEQTQKDDRDMRERSGSLDGRFSNSSPPSLLAPPPLLPPPSSKSGSTSLPPSTVTKSTNKVSFAGKPNLVLLWTNSNPENIWPKTMLRITVWPKSVMDLNWSINSTSMCLTMTRNRFWLDYFHRKLIPPLSRPLLLPLPWPPPMLTPPLTPPLPAFTPLSPLASTPPPPPLALNLREIEESEKLLWQKFIKKLDGELDLLDMGAATYGGPDIEVHFNFNSAMGLINSKTIVVGIIEGLGVVVLTDNGETDTHYYISEKVENKMGDSCVEFALMNLILMMVVCLSTFGLFNPTVDGIHKLSVVGNRKIMGTGANTQGQWDENSTMIGRSEVIVNRYNSAASRLAGINRTSYLVLNETDEGLDNHSEVVNFKDEQENEDPWLSGTEDTCLQGWKLNRKDLQTCEGYGRILRWGTIKDDEQYAWESQVGGIQGVNKVELEFEEFIHHLRMIGCSKKSFEGSEEIPKDFPFDRGREVDENKSQNSLEFYKFVEILRSRIGNFHFYPP